MSSATISAAIFAPIVTFPTLFIRLILGRNARWGAALVCGALCGLAYAPLSYQLFLPLAHRMTTGPSAPVWGSYALAGLLAGAVWAMTEQVLKQQESEIPS